MKNLLFTLVLLSSTFLACNFDNNSSSSESTAVEDSSIVTEILDIPAFHSIGLGISANIYLTPSSSQQIKVEGQKNIIDLLSREVDDEKWNVEFEKSRVRNYKKLNIYISMPAFKNLSIGGSGDIVTEKIFKNLEDLNLNIGGSGSMDLNINASEIKSSIGGSGSINLHGTAARHNISIAGSGSVNAYKMDVDHSKVNIAGSGDVKVQVKNELVVSIAGSGDVYYKGRPEVTKSIVGSGKLQDAN